MREEADKKPEQDRKESAQQVSPYDIFGAAVSLALNASLGQEARRHNDRNKAKSDSRKPAIAAKSEHTAAAKQQLNNYKFGYGALDPGAKDQRVSDRDESALIQSLQSFSL